ncbi:MAG TPA: circadian clock KaiB family protein [Planctomycetota bacterium]|nr:circadian clock KaiB family protein [Planctomycetota bacterium]
MGPHRLTLFVAGAEALRGPLIGRVQRACRELGEGRVELELVDALAEPERARAAGVRLTPTLLAGEGPLARRVFGDLTDVREALWAVGAGA